ncbi:amidohydrolase family protein [Kordiimonas sp.]|uniref:amidohydrolase family protein n=1 Tax=Kordiimonas sp. TaxID=1970157 RepID=UPI003A939A59
MMQHFKHIVGLCLAFTLGLTTSAQADTTVITGGTLIDSAGTGPIADAVMVIRDGRIQAAGPRTAIELPADAREIDATGKFIIPGLMDANVHLYLNLDLETLIKYEGRYQDIIIEGAQLALKTGQTTVFDTWGPYPALKKARDMLNSGEAIGSRIYFAGNIIGFDGPLSADFREAAAAHVSKAMVSRLNADWEQDTGRDLMWMGPDEVRGKVDAYAAKDVDFLKYGASGHVAMEFITFSPRVQKEIVAAGHAAGKTVQVHTTSTESLDMAIDAGVDILTHCDITGPVKTIPEATLAKMVERGIPCSIVPITQHRLDAYIEQDPNQVMATYQGIGRKNIANMIKAGVSILLSTDAGVKSPLLMAESKQPKVDMRTELGEGHFNAFTALEELGMAPLEILRSATLNTAKAYKLDGDLGSLEAGKIADVVILDANPLDAAANYRSIHMVIKDGVVVDTDALPLAPVVSNQMPPEEAKE